VTEHRTERLGVEAFQALFDRCSNWGRWGPDDERGTLNLITPEHRVRAAGLVREGFTVSCAPVMRSTGYMAVDALSRVRPPAVSVRRAAYPAAIRSHRAALPDLGCQV
jgi:hypothetical protein